MGIVDHKWEKENNVQLKTAKETRAIVTFGDTAIETLVMLGSDGIVMTGIELSLQLQKMQPLLSRKVETYVLESSCFGHR